MELVEEVHNLTLKAYNRIQPYVHHTPLEKSLYFSNKTGANLYLKLESQQKTGSFKVRGAFNKLLPFSSNTDDSEKKTFVTASSGNHGLASALAMTTLKLKGVVYVPEYASSAKVDKIKLFGVETRRFGADCVDAEKKARATAELEEAVYVSPYADLQIIGGQGTVGKEIFDDLNDVDSVFVTVGGGGLISGIGSFLKTQKKNVEIVGCLPTNSPCMYESIKAGNIVPVQSLDTLSDGSAGDIEEGSVTFPLCQKVVDRWILVSETEIANAMRLMLEKHCKVVEGAAGVALASFLKVADEYVGKNVVVVICGANVSIEKLKEVID